MHTRKIQVTEENGHCEGHFPGHPVVPAAVQLLWVMDLAREAEGLLPEHCQVRTLKLSRELNPPRDVELSLRESAGRWKATVASGDDVFAEMDLVWPRSS